MFENSPLADLAIGRSTVRQRILALLICEEPGRLHLREIQRRVGTSPGTASRELGRLVAAGLIDRESEGVQVYFRVSGSPVGTMMRQLFLLQERVPPAAVPPVNLDRRRQARARGSQGLPSGSTRPPRTAAAERLNPPTAPRAVLQLPEPAAETERLISSESDPAPMRQPRVFGALETGTDSASTGGSAPSPSQASSPATSEPTRDASVSPAADPLGLLVGARFSAEIRPLYESRLKAVYLYGARASSPAPEDAEVELLVVLDAVDSYGDELERTSAIVARLSLELGLVVSRVFAREAAVSPMPGFVAVMSTTPEAAA